MKISTLRASTHQNLIMNKHLIALAILVCALLSSATATAQQRPDHKQWVTEMNTLRINFITNELGLTEEQRQKFTPIYEAMQREVMKLRKETSDLYKSVSKKGAAATDIEKEKAAEAQYECKGKENAIEMRYFKQFKSVLTLDQLLKLPKAERKFHRQLQKYRKANK